MRWTSPRSIKETFVPADGLPLPATWAEVSFVLRRAGVDDTGTVLGLFDGAVAWLVARGLTRQWGDRPWSTIPRRRQQVGSWLAAPSGSWLAETDEHVPVGFLHLGAAPSYVEPAVAPEGYVVALVGSRAPEGRGAGRALLDLAVRDAAERGLPRVRVDCYAGDGGRLAAF